MALQQMGHDLAGIEQVLHEALSREGRPILAAYLFGSTARGTARGHSDIDVAVLLAETPHTLGERFGLESRL